MNRELVNSFVRLESEIAKERGDFVLFALLSREDLPDRWDLIVSAPWIRDRDEALKYLVQKIQSTIGAPVLTDLSRIVFANFGDQAVQNLNRAFHVEHGMFEVKDSNILGLPIKHGFIITSKRPRAAAAG